MTLGIKVYEKDDYLYSLIKERLQINLPTAYICNYRSENFKFTNNIRVIFDNKQFSIDSIEDSYRSKAIPLYENNIIDIKRITKAITNIDEPIHDISETNDQIRLLISFSYIDERESFINQVISPNSFNGLHPIRIDLMSSIRMLDSSHSNSNNALSNLLRSCTQKNFTPERILQYLGPDSSGFLTPGKPINDDDVFDIGIKASARLMELTKELCQKMNSGALFVAEGWRLNEMFELIARCDSLHILLPARMCTEDTGMSNELGLFQRNLKSGCTMTIHYYEDYKNKQSEIKYDSIRI